MDKRTHIRTSLQDDTGLLPVDLPLGKETEVLDISAFGACIVTSRMLERGKKVNFSLNLTDSDERVIFIAEVKWSRPAENNKYKIGLEFVG